MAKLPIRYSKAPLLRPMMLWLLVVLVLMQTGCNLGMKFFSPGSGQIEIQGQWPPPEAALGAKLIPQRTAAIEVRLSGSGMSVTRTQRVVRNTANPEPLFTIVFENVPLGNKSLDVYLHGPDGTPFYNTRVNVMVEAGKTVEAVLDLDVPAILIPSPSATPVATAVPTVVPSSTTTPTTTPTPIPTPIPPAGTLLGTFTVGTGPYDIAIDSSGNAWVANFGPIPCSTGNTVTKLSPSGSTLGTFTVGTCPSGISIDSSGNAWVSNFGSNNATKLSPSGSVLGTFAVGTNPVGIAVDSSGNAWIANQATNDVTKLSPSGSNLGTFAVGTNPRHIAIDSSGNAWVANEGNGNVTKLSPTGTSLGTFTVGSNPYHIAIDGDSNVWVINNTSVSVTKLSAAGVTLGTFTPGTNGPIAIAIDGSGNAWVTSSGSNNVTKLSSTGNLLGTFTVGASPYGIAIDSSSSVWVTNFGSNGSGNTVTKLSAGPVPTTSPTPAPVGTVLASFPMTTARQVRVDSQGNVWVNNSGGLSKMKNDGTILATVPGGNFVLDGSDNVWVSGGGNMTKYDPAGNVLTSFPLANGGVFAIDSQGNFWVNERGTSPKTIIKISPSGTVLGTFSPNLHTTGVAIEANDDVWVGANDDNYTIFTGNKLSNTGAPLFTDTSLGNMVGLYAIDHSTGTVWAGPFGATSIVKLTPTGPNTYNKTTHGGGTLYVLDMALDSGGNVWTTHGCFAKLHRWDSSGSLVNTWNNFGPGCGPNDGPWNIAIDRNRPVIWVTDNDTIIKLSTGGPVGVCRPGGLCP